MFVLRGSGAGIVGSADTAGSLTRVGAVVEDRGERPKTAVVLWGSPISVPTGLRCLSSKPGGKDLSASGLYER